ncbi:MAG TPA: hypothetical protein VJU18_19810, partial [Vicinamibacteria bacterium]|nr:hypothetical protein [Vicinamibacteria bacterium]
LRFAADPQRSADVARGGGDGMDEQSSEAERSPGARALTLFGMIIGGAVVGGVMRLVVAPDSAVAFAISCAMLPFALLSGLGLWLSAALGLGVARLIGSVFVPRWRKPWGQGRRFVPPGSALIVATCLGYSVGGATAVAAVSSRATLMPTLTLFATGGLVYGVAAWRLARLGFLSPTEEA